MDNVPYHTDVLKSSLNINSSSSSMNDERLKEAWFMYRILPFIRTFEAWPRNKDSHVNIEKICEYVYPEIRSDF